MFLLTINFIFGVDMDGTIQYRTTPLFALVQKSETIKEQSLTESIRDLEYLYKKADQELKETAKKFWREISANPTDLPETPSANQVILDNALQTAQNIISSIVDPQEKAQTEFLLYLVFDELGLRYDRYYHSDEYYNTH